VSTLQVVRHLLLVPHAYKPQFTVLFWLHVPLPVHVDGGW